MSFPLFTTIPPKSDFRPFIKNWEESGFRVTSINNLQEAETLRALGVHVIEVDSKEKKLKISEIMRAIVGTGERFVGFINSDCRFIQPIDIEALRPMISRSLIMAERIDVTSAGRATMTLSHGFDAFFFDTVGLHALPQKDYRIGEPWWDYWFPFEMRSAGLALKRFSCPVLLHAEHKLNWDEAAYIKNARVMHETWPRLRIFENGELYPFRSFDELSNSSPVFPPGFDEATAPLFSSIHSLVKDLHTQHDIARSLRATLADPGAEMIALQNEVAALRNSNSYRIAYPLRLASTIIRRAIGWLKGDDLGSAKARREF
jgi:hypothetical protein